jgi:transforming growth factor-beta-induced protein
MPSDATTPGSISALVQGNPDTSVLFSALQRVGFVDALDQQGNFTFFAATNTGFGLIPQEISDLLFLNDEFIPHFQSLILYSILNGQRFSTSFTDTEVLPTFNSEPVGVAIDPFRVNGITVVTPDIAGNNGVIHTIDGVLAPTWVFNSLRNRTRADPDLTILSELLDLVNIDLDTFGDELTLLAPVDAGFLALGNETLDALRGDVAVLQEILEYHIIVGVFISNEITQSPGPFLTLEGRDVTFDAATSMFNNAAAVAGDILANNGVLFKLDAVLEFPSEVRLTPTPVPTSAPAVAVGPSQTIMEILLEREDLSRLVTAANRAQMDEVLGRPGPFTLFAPSNQAFDLLPSSVSDKLFTDVDFLPHLRDLLLHHIVPEQYKRLDFSDNLELTTLTTEKVIIKRVPIRVNGIRFTQPNVDAVNGVVHVIAEVLTPSWVTSNLLDRVTADSELSTLRNLAVMAGVDLSSAGAFTLLAPTNEAFARLPSFELEALMAHEPELKIVLEAHVLLGVWTVAELTAGDYETVAGNTVTVQVTPSVIFGENAYLAEFGMLANNGIMFKITEVLSFGNR